MLRFSSLILVLVLVGCSGPDLLEECTLDEDCLEGQVCLFSSCTVPTCEQDLILCGIECVNPTIELEFCGGCNGCRELDGAIARACHEGKCQYECNEGTFDADEDLDKADSNGCECAPSADGVELCDGIDNDCNGLFDAEDPTFDPSSCPPEPGAVATGCQTSQCTYRCKAGFNDVDEDLGLGGNGCECAIEAAELCDGLDNDCDGTIDEDPDLNRCPLVEGAVAQTCGNGACQYACDGGRVDINGDLERGVEGNGCECANSYGGIEVCDLVDNDCDGLTDEGPDLGQCAALQGSEAIQCTAGACVYQCSDDSVDLNTDIEQGIEGDGCECTLTQGGREVCDGVDNDCDGLSDLDDEDFEAELCSEQRGVCQGASAPCEGELDSSCETAVFIEHARGLSLTYEADEETLCDQQDNDCDGETDDLCCGEEQPFIDLLGDRAPTNDYVDVSLAFNDDRSLYATAILRSNDRVEAAVFDEDRNLVGDRVTVFINNQVPLFAMCWASEAFWVVVSDSLNGLRMKRLDTQGRLGIDTINVPEVPRLNAFGFECQGLSADRLAIVGTDRNSALSVTVISTTGTVLGQVTEPAVPPEVYDTTTVLADERRLFIAGERVFFAAPAPPGGFILSLEHAPELSRVSFARFERADNEDGNVDSHGATIVLREEGLSQFRIHRSQQGDPVSLIAEELNDSLEVVDQANFVLSPESDNMVVGEVVALRQGVAVSFVTDDVVINGAGFAFVAVLDEQNIIQGVRPLFSEQRSLKGIELVPHRLGVMAMIPGQPQGGIGRPLISILGQAGDELCP